jgi:AraC-like DNA-binding protein
VSPSDEACAGAPADVLEFASPPELPGLEVLRIDAAARRWRWFHETYSIVVPLMPLRTEWRYRGKTHETSPGIIALMEPGEIHADVRKLDDHEVVRALFVSPPTMQDAARELGVSSAPVSWREAQVNGHDLYGEIVRLHASLEHEATPLERQTRFAGVVERLVEEFSDRRPRSFQHASEPAAVRQARELLHAHWDENVRLDDLVAVSGIGRYHLVRAFRAAVGVPPHAYQIRLRVSRAMQLIRVGLPLAQVALETGFADQSHLARHFTRVTGVSPGRYRQAAS